MRTRLQLTLPRPTARARLAALAVALAAALWVLPGAALAAPSPTPTPTAKAAGLGRGPQLSIAIDNGRTSAKAGDQLTYTVTVTNLGTTDIKRLILTQRIPAGTALVDAGEGTAKADLVEWKVKLKAAKKASFRTTLKLGKTPADLLRVAAVACAQTSPTGPPLVCSADSDLLPAGAEAQQKQAAVAEVPGGPWWSVPLLLAGAAVVVAVPVLSGRRRRAAAD